MAITLNMETASANNSNSNNKIYDESQIASFCYVMFRELGS